MDSVRENAINILDNIRGVWFTNQKQANIKKVNRISNIEKSIRKKVKIKELVG